MATGIELVCTPHCFEQCLGRVSFYAQDLYGFYQRQDLCDSLCDSWTLEPAFLHIQCGVATTHQCYHSVPGTFMLGTKKGAWMSTAGFGTNFVKYGVGASVSREAGVSTLEPFITLDRQFSSVTSALHYGHSIFEGMKAFRQENGDIAIFRLRDHAQRFVESAKKMAMPIVGVETFEAAVKGVIQRNYADLDFDANASLYLRPFMFACDEKIKLDFGNRFTFHVIASVVGDYFGKGATKGANLLVSKKFIRAYPNGIGEAKTAANYAMSLPAQQKASDFECDQVLFLDARTHQYVDELGGMNFFYIRGDQLVTPRLSGSILHGITRRSILTLANDLGLKPLEDEVKFDELVDNIKDGIVSEAFACGTAAVVQPISSFKVWDAITDQMDIVKLSDDFKQTLKIREYLVDIQHGRNQRYKDWLTVVEDPGELKQMAE